MSKAGRTQGPKVLFFDIEIAPIRAYVWGLFDQNVGLNQIETDWHVLSWSAKWLGDSEILYADQRGAKNVEDDKYLLKGIWHLLDEADIVVTQNGKKFDVKKLNARFIINGFQPPSSFKHIDTLQLAKKHFGFTSNKLEYLSNTLNAKFKKLVGNREYEGFKLWTECLAGNLKAWKEMERYNKYDVLALEELYNRMIPWDSTVNFSLYREGNEHVCTCGSSRLQKRGYEFTSTGKYQRYQCQECGKWSRGAVNLFTSDKRQSLTRNVKG
ncbi:COG3359 Predicted exonuclease [uncultured Caudovirales phage]|uniref:COG3359 Predicted exonuclease n=1 Tax=uncultured Caudovirales phage TaxID=2100421 RepID=A0A6J5S0M5_9CAUD|nr:COG3359 Predicted exonuclease [uncultured Caudovirales phage]